MKIIYCIAKIIFVINNIFSFFCSKMQKDIKLVRNIPPPRLLIITNQFNEKTRDFHVSFSVDAACSAG